MLQSNKLEIFLITYNRLENLKHTLSLFFSKDSPIKKNRITILNNNSTDGTTEFLDDFVKKHSNVIHVRHNRNIGGNANIVRCFDYVKSDYFWITCDDDEYDWGNWVEVENAMNEDYNCIFVSNTEKPQENFSQALCQAAFLPSCIYKSSILNEVVLQNAYINISFSFPHLALLCEVINRKESIYYCGRSIVMNGIYTKKTSSEANLLWPSHLHPHQKHFVWPLLVLQASLLLEDKSIYKSLFDDFTAFGEKKMRPKGFLDLEWDEHKGNNYKYNKVVYYHLLPNKYKPCYILLNLIFCIKSILKRNAFCCRLHSLIKQFIKK